jgi:molybdopterin biosynthesis enzyme
MEKSPVRIEDWAVVDSVSAAAWSALEPGRRLTGRVNTHAELPSGFIYTSVIVRVDEAEGLVETYNNIYQLGRRSSEYESWLQRQGTQRAA